MQLILRLLVTDACSVRLLTLHASWRTSLDVKWSLPSSWKRFNAKPARSASIAALCTRRNCTRKGRKELRVNRWNYLIRNNSPFYDKKCKAKRFSLVTVTDWTIVGKKEDFLCSSRMPTIPAIRATSIHFISNEWASHISTCPLQVCVKLRTGSTRKHP